MTWSTITKGSHEWIIVDFTPDDAATQLAGGSQSAPMWFADCSQCQDSVRYGSPADALDHLYSRHFQTLSTDRPKWPTDDPLFVWIRKVSPGPARTLSENRIFPIVERFIDDLLDLKEAIQSVHLVVASVSSDNGDRSSTPFLPTSLVHAFGKIIHTYILTSKRLSLTNRFRSLDHPARGKREVEYKRRDSKMQSERRDSLDHALSLLDEAKTDILMSEFRSPTQTINSLGVERVSSDFLVATLITSVQQRKFIPGKTSGSDDEKKGDGMAALFREYLARLEFEAMRRPKRRVFVDINELQEEMEAHLKILWSQHETLEDLRRVFYGWSSRRHTEDTYITDQLRRLSRAAGEIGSLQQKAFALKNEVKQTIEVLEEGHGRAIRVSTIVTLFFLPL